jgi:hypothetical protein
MKPATLKELLKPPFSYDGKGYIRDSSGFELLELVASTTDCLNVKGKFIATALNEKWERDFGEQEKKSPVNIEAIKQVANELDNEWFNIEHSGETRYMFTEWRDRLLAACVEKVSTNG